MSSKYSGAGADDSSDFGWAMTGRTLLRCGWSVGKKVAIVGVAISVAPFVIPPLLVISAFGLAFSVPIGILYAGWLGVERLMQFLLPFPQGQEVWQGNRVDGDETVEGEKGYLDEIRESRSEDNLERNGEDESAETMDDIMEEGKYYVGNEDSKPEGNGEEGGDDDAIVEIPDETDIGTKEHGETIEPVVVVESLDERGEMVEEGKENGSKSGSNTEKNGEEEDKVVEEISIERIAGEEETEEVKKDDGVNVEIPVEMDDASKEHGGMDKSDGIESMDEEDEIVETGKVNVSTQPDRNGEKEDNVVTEISKERVAGDEENGAVKKDNADGDNGVDGNNGTVDKDYTMEKSELKPAEVKSTTVTEGTERAGAEAEQVETGNTDLVEEEEVMVAVTDSRYSKKEDNELNADNLEGDDGSEVKGKSDLADAESQPSGEHVGEASAESPATDAEVKQTYSCFLISGVDFVMPIHHGHASILLFHKLQGKFCLYTFLENL